ncbi:hypothetical protein FQA39_LY00722 [Lamprigera yunnana]|nr:hypothetical protein FQA39_LY00722 [Lamprigera yunnana]
MKDNNSLTKRIESAIIIQRYFRNYLRKVTREKSTEGGNKFNKRITQTSDVISAIKNGLQNYYEKMNKNRSKLQVIYKSLSKMDALSHHLVGVKNLKGCERMQLDNLKSSAILMKAKKRHEKELQRYKLQWWEKLSESEDNNSVT